jgi:hypothetical protein
MVAQDDGSRNVSLEAKGSQAGRKYEESKTTVWGQKGEISAPYDELEAKKRKTRPWDMKRRPSKMSNSQSAELVDFADKKDDLCNADA